MIESDPKPKRSSPHVEPLPSRAARPPQRRRGFKRWLLLFGALTLGIGAGATWLFAPESQDRLTPTEIEQRAAAFAKAPPLVLKAIPASELDRRLGEMQLAPVAQVELKQTLRASTAAAPDAAPAAKTTPQAAARPDPASMRLVELTLWDSHAPDGDVVRIVSAGYSRDVMLQKQPVVVAVPVQGSSIQIVGVRDGGGGITLGVQGSSTPMMMPIMSEGQTISLPVAP